MPTKEKEASSATCKGQANIREILVKYQGKSSLRQYRSKIKPITQHLEMPWQYRSKNGEHVSIERNSPQGTSRSTFNIFTLHEKSNFGTFFRPLTPPFISTFLINLKRRLESKLC